MSEIYKGLTPQEDYQRLLDMLDLVFFSEKEDDTVFMSLLPHLYKPQYDPCSKNYIVKEGGDICAAVGFYTYNVNAGGEKLVFSGIGNVAVHPDHRSKGYMIDCMKGAIEKQKEQGAAVSLLGGQKQRYGYFGFEPAGAAVWMSISPTNIRHVFGKDARSGFDVREVTAQDKGLLDFIAGIYRSKPFYVERPENEHYDILCSGRSKAYAAFDGERAVGYFVINHWNDIVEFGCADPDEACKLAMAAVEFTGGRIKFRLPVFDRQVIKNLLPLTESDSLEHCEMFMILNFEAAVRAFLKVRASYETLCDGEMTLLIHGTCGDEQIKVSVQNNAVTVTPCGGAYDLELEAKEATRLLFSINSTVRDKLSPAARSWLPLPIYCYSCDAV